eukprot:52732-Rhodomonas_salina.2
MQVAHERLSHEQLRTRFPYLSFPPGSVGVYETEVSFVPGLAFAGAGYLSARKLVQAQTVLAEKGGCHVISEEATSVEKIQGGSQNSGSELFEVTLKGGSKVLSKKVLVAVGAFVNSRKLLPAGKVRYQPTRALRDVLY